MTKISNIIGYVFTAAVLILAADFLFFCMWIASGQHPADGFYAGAITANIIGLFI